jgi:molybdopterin-guanine dinucleotide biosynthesis protein A
MMKTQAGCAGLLLTGGASRRMGQHKATMVVPDDGVNLARRTAALLEQVVDPAFELGLGFSSLPAVAESAAGGGPLVAVASGWTHLSAAGWSGPVLVVATDLPLLTVDLLDWLVQHWRQVVRDTGTPNQP